MRKRFIGLVGEKGGGKGKFTDQLRLMLPNLTIGHHRSSDPLLQTMRVWGIESTRSNFSSLAEGMERIFGEGALSRAVGNYLKNDPSDIVIFDGIRWISDVEIFKNFNPHTLIYITADQRLRWQRTLKRGEKAGESNTSFEKFKEEELAKTERYIPEIGRMADYRIENNGTIEVFNEAIKEVIRNITHTP